MHDSSKAELIRWKYIATAFIVLTGSVLHFTYGWSGHSKVLALFSPINESAWEHLKMAFWPGVILALFETRRWRRHFPAFWFAEAIGILTSVAGICLIWYGYTGILGNNYLILDILCFVLAVTAGQITAYVLMTKLGENTILSILGFTLITLLGAAFLIFTFWAPEIHLFRDPSTGTNGLQSHN